MSASKRRRRSCSTDASDGSRKVLCTKSSNSPSSTSNNDHGQSQLDKHLSSVLCHPLGLPLVSAFHGKDPGELPHLRQESNFFSSKGEDKKYDNVLQSAVNKWRPGRRGKKLETNLTSILTGFIQDTVCKDEILLKAKKEYPVSETSKKGRVDIALCKGSNAPLLFLDVGLKGADWSKKFDQVAMYVRMKYAEGKHETFKGPLLVAVMTIDDAKQSKLGNQAFRIKLAVFLCTRKSKEDNENVECFRMSLLWLSKTCKLKDGSEAFGRLLRRVCDFSSWMAKVEKGKNALKYEYFSSNCCRVDDDFVLRSYDNRVRPTTRSPAIYMSKECTTILGDVADVTKVILNLQVTFLDSVGDATDKLWNAEANTRSLQVIVTPYRHGTHLATKPKSFLPIIADLIELHDMDFVHGDIRGFNTVFDENGRGCLIDFDFGGKHGIAQYPRGYRVDLGDGKRVKVQYPSIVQKWHDWYALGRLIFEVHDVVPPDEAPDKDLVTKTKLDDALKLRREVPTNEMIAELTDFLTRIDETGWTVQPNLNFEDELKMVFGLTTSGMERTNPRATGSPPKG